MRADRYVLIALKADFTKAILRGIFHGMLPIWVFHPQRTVSCFFIVVILLNLFRDVFIIFIGDMFLPYACEDIGVDKVPIFLMNSIRSQKSFMRKWCPA